MSHSQYGVFVMAASTMAIICSVASFGLSQVLVQLSPRVGADGAQVVMRYTLLVGAVIAAGVAVLTGIACIVLGANHYQTLAVTLAIMIPIAAVAPFMSSLSGFLQSVQQPKRLAKALLVTPLMPTATFVALCVTTHPAATWIAAARTSAVIITLVLLVVVVHRAGGLKRPGPEPSPDSGVSLGRVITLGSSLLGGTLSAILLAQLDVLFLGFARGRESAAFYGPASLIADNALTMAAIVGTFYLPAIATLLTRKEFVEAGDVYRWASRWSFVLIAPVVAVMLACPASVLTLLFGADYDQMSTPVRILALGVLVNVLFGFNGITVDSLNKVKLIVSRQAVALAFNVAACAVLIPRFGAIGAAVATSSSLLVMNLTASLLLFRQTGITPFNPRLLAVACGLAVSIACGLAVHSVPMENVLRMVLVGAVSVMLCAGVSYFLSSPSERRAIKAAIGSRLTKLAFHHPFHPAA
jgi:O-antigen/teichoic acid export membrane protein